MNGPAVAARYAIEALDRPVKREAFGWPLGIRAYRMVVSRDKKVSLVTIFCAD